MSSGRLQKWIVRLWASAWMAMLVVILTNHLIPARYRLTWGIKIFSILFSIPSSIRVALKAFQRTDGFTGQDRAFRESKEKCLPIAKRHTVSGLNSMRKNHLTLIAITILRIGFPCQALS